jgi:hypothetical protein
MVGEPWKFLQLRGANWRFTGEAQSAPDFQQLG